MNVIEITNDKDITEKIYTEGYTILYLDGNNIKVTGQFDTKSLMPMLSKLLLEKMSK